MQVTRQKHLHIDRAQAADRQKTPDRTVDSELSMGSMQNVLYDKTFSHRNYM